MVASATTTASDNAIAASARALHGTPTSAFRLGEAILADYLHALHKLDQEHCNALLSPLLACGRRATGLVQFWYSINQKGLYSV